jgi:hypothetical protein
MQDSALCSTTHSSGLVLCQQCTFKLFKITDLLLPILWLDLSKLGLVETEELALPI